MPYADEKVMRKGRLVLLEKHVSIVDCVPKFIDVIQLTTPATSKTKVKYKHQILDDADRLLH